MQFRAKFRARSGARSGAETSGAETSKEAREITGVSCPLARGVDPAVTSKATWSITVLQTQNDYRFSFELIFKN